MKIKLQCSGCGSAFAADGRLAGKKVKCPKCGSSIAVPQPKANEPEPSMGIDFNLMVEAAQPVKEGSNAAEEKDTMEKDAVDWDALAGPSPFTAGAEKKPERAPASSAGMIARLAAYDPRAARQEEDIAIDQGGVPMGGNRSTEAFLRQAANSLFFSLAYLPQIITLILIDIVVQVSFFAAVYLSAPLFAGNVDLFIALFISIGVSINLLFAGYVQRYFMGVTAVTSQGGEAFGLPDFSVVRVLKSLALAILFVLVYIVPIVTIPLAPVAYLIISRTQDLRGFDVIWVAKMTARYLLYTLTVLVFGVIFMVVVAIVAVAITAPVARFIVRIAPDLTPSGTMMLFYGFLIFVLVPLWLMLLTSLARMVGLIGRHSRWMLQNVPRQTNYSVVLPSAVATCLIGILFASFYLPKVREYTESRARESARLARERSSPSSGSSGRSTPGGNNQPSRPAFPSRPTVVDPFAKLNEQTPQEKIDTLLRHVDQPSPHREAALRHLGSLGPIADRPRVIDAIERVIRSESDARVLGMAQYAHFSWTDDELRGQEVFLASVDERMRSDAVARLVTATVVDDRRDDIMQALERCAPTLRTSTGRINAIKAMMHWSRDPKSVLVRALEGKSTSSDGKGALLPIVAQQMGDDGPDLIIDYITRNPHDADAGFEALRLVLTAAEPRVIAVLQDKDSPIRAQAAQWLRWVVTNEEAATAVLMEAAGDKDNRVSMAARDSLQRIAPDSLDELSLLLLEVTPDRINSSTGRRALEKLAQMEVDPERRPQVIAAVAPLAEESSFVASAAAQIMGRWADEETINLLKSWIEAESPLQSARRRNAIEGLAAHGSEDAARMLVPLLSDSTVRSQTQSALTRMGPAAERDVLRTLQLSKDDDVRLPCVNILEKVGGAHSLQTLIALAKARVNSPLTYPARRAVIAIQDRLKKE